MPQSAVAQTMEALLALASPTPGCECDTCRGIRRHRSTLEALARQLRAERPWVTA